MPLNELVAESPKEIELRLLPKLDMLRVKDKKDRGTITVKVRYTTKSTCCAIEVLCSYVLIAVLKFAGIVS